MYWVRKALPERLNSQRHVGVDGGRSGSVKPCGSVLVYAHHFCNYITEISLNFHTVRLKYPFCPESGEILPDVNR